MRSLIIALSATLIISSAFALGKTSTVETSQCIKFKKTSIPAKNISIISKKNNKSITNATVYPFHNSKSIIRDGKSVEGIVLKIQNPEQLYDFCQNKSESVIANIQKNKGKDNSHRALLSKDTGKAYINGVSFEDFDSSKYSVSFSCVNLNSDKNSFARAVNN